MKEYRHRFCSSTDEDCLPSLFPSYGGFRGLRREAIMQLRQGPVEEEGTSGIYLLETRERNNTWAIHDMRFATQCRF